MQGSTYTHIVVRWLPWRARRISSLLSLSLRHSSFGSSSIIWDIGLYWWMNRREGEGALRFRCWVSWEEVRCVFFFFFVFFYSSLLRRVVWSFVVSSVSTVCVVLCVRVWRDRCFFSCVRIRLIYINICVMPPLRVKGKSIR